MFFIFTPTWGHDPIWLMFFRWVETTNQLSIGMFFEFLQLCCEFSLWLSLWLVCCVSWQQELPIKGDFGISLGNFIQAQHTAPVISTKNCSWFSWFICVKHPVADHQELGQISCHFRKQKTNLKISLTCLQSYNSCWNPGKFMVKLGPNFCQCQAPPLWKTMVANYPLIFGLLMIAGRGIAIP